MKSLREPYDSLIESLKRPTHDGTFDWPSPDPLHMSAVKAIEELIAGLSSQIGISTTLRSALATAEATAAERGERIAVLEKMTRDSAAMLNAAIRIVRSLEVHPEGVGLWAEQVKVNMAALAAAAAPQEQKS